MTRPIGIYFLHLFICVLLPNIVSSQIIFQDIHGKMSRQEMMMMFKEALIISDSLEDTRKDAYMMQILYRGKDLLLFNHGFFDVYQWQKNHWKALNTEKRGGYNYGAKKFIWNNRIFSFGGYGYWQHHGDLIEFDPSSGTWKKLNLSEALPLGPAMINGDVLRIISDTCFDVNLHTLQVNKYPIESLSKTEKSLVAKGIKTESRLWDFFALGKYNFLFHKTENKLYYSDVLTTEVVDKSFFYHHSLIQFKNDSLLKWSPDGLLLSTIDLKELIKFYQPVEINPKQSKLPIMLGGISTILLISAAIIFWRKRQRKTKLTNKSWQNPMISKIIPLAGTTISTDQIDNILALDGVVIMEYRKFKRSKLISQINDEFKLKFGKELVVRIKDPDDGRKFLYEIKV